MGLLVAVVIGPVSGREVSPVGAVAEVEIVDEEGSVSVAITVSSEVSCIEPKSIQKLYTLYQNSLQMKLNLLMHHLPVVAISSEVISAVKSIIMHALCVFYHLPGGNSVVELVGATVVESHWSLNLTSAMCTHSIVPDVLLISMK